MNLRKIRRELAFSVVFHRRTFLDYFIKRIIEYSMINFFKKITPEIIKKQIRPYFLRRGEELKKDFFCPICESHIDNFNPISWSCLKNLDNNCHIHSIFVAEMFNFTAYSCPICNESDRNRLYALYIMDRFKQMDQSKEYVFIEFAPSKELSKKIKSYPFIRYRSADLFMKDVDDVVDITNMLIYKDNSVDMFLCSHVLEHVIDDKKAVKELYRILKPGGWGILVSPILLTLERTYEDFSITTEAERWKHFGQNDHVRVYAKHDYVKLLEEPGFKVLQLGEEFFRKEVYEKRGINPRSVLYVVEK
jgi:SAM-dependent methyltransferase